MLDLNNLKCSFEEAKYQLVYYWETIPLGHRVPGGPEEKWFYWCYFTTLEAADAYGKNLPWYTVKNKPYEIKKMY